jgi:hypothetical protein
MPTCVKHLVRDADTIDKKLADTPPEQLRRPFTTDVKFESLTITSIPAGFSEFKRHPAHGQPIRRCMAKHPDGNQCGRFALKDRRICRRHSAGTRHRPDSMRGQHWNEGKGETREARQKRSETAKEIKLLEKQAMDNGVFVCPAMRGPYKSDLKTYQARRQKRIAKMLKEFEEAMKRRGVAV